MQLLSSNPQLATQLIQSDPQVQQALSVILGGLGGDGPASAGDSPAVRYPAIPYTPCTYNLRNIATHF
jgi:hypothetical protein